MKQTDMLERKAKDIRLSEQGRWDLLKKGEGDMKSKKVVEDSGAEKARLQAGVEDLRVKFVPHQSPSAPVAAGSLLVKHEGKLSALGVNLMAPKLLTEMEELTGMRPSCGRRQATSHRRWC
jgi:hypothetical protein